MIKRIRARNFGPFADLQSPELARINIVLGPNGGGKSTVKKALCVLFSGTAEGFESGQGLDGLRTIGVAATKRFQIDAQLVIAGKEHAISRTEGEGPKSSRQTLMESLTKTTGAKARACIEAGELVRLDAKARQRLILDLAPKGTVTLAPPHRKAIQELLGEDLGEIDLPTLERLYKAAYEARTEAGRVVTALGELVAPDVPAALEIYDHDGGMDLPDAAEIRAALADLRRERDLALHRSAPKVADLGPYETAVKNGQRDLERVQKEIGALPTTMEITRRGHEIVAKLKEAGETNIEIEEKRRKLKEQMGAAEGAMRHAKTALDAVKAQGVDAGCCPVCDSKLTKVGRGKLEVTLTNKYEAAGREWQRIKEVLSVTVDPLSTAALEREAGDLSTKEERLATLLEDEKRIAAALLDAQTALVKAQADPGTPGDPAAADDAKALQDRIAKGEGLLEAVVAYESATRTYRDANVRKTAAENKRAALSQLVEDLGPAGIRKHCGNAGMLKFHDDLNGLLKPRGFVVDLRPAMDLAGDPLVTIGTRQIPLGMLSDGEKLAFGAAFACAVASYTGLGIVVVDKFEQLTYDTQPIVFEMLQASGHQVFILSGQRDADDEMTARAKQFNADGNVRMFLLRDGQLVAPGLKERAA